MNKNQREIAIEEWKLLESIIGRYEEIFFKIRGWLYALIAAFIIAFISGKISFCWWQFFIIGLFFIVFFLFLEFLQRGPIHRARNRAELIEDSIRKDESYVGPELSKSLRGSGSIWSDFQDAWIELKKVPRFWGPYVILAILIGIFAIIDLLDS